MQKLLAVYKPKGVTPYEIVKKIKQSNPHLANAKIGYAGRLDPLAHGVLLLMIGDETKNRDKYLSLPKSYEFEVVFGLQTDTYDMLGILKHNKEKQIPENVKLFVNTFVNKYIGKRLQQYPPYSSKTVNGKPLFWWARNNKLTDITMPVKEIEIFTFTVGEIGELPINQLKQRVYEAINSVTGDFRQDEIKKSWDEYFINNKTKKLPLVKFNITCSSGTYVRELVNQMGRDAGCGALAIDILRTVVGVYTLEEIQKF